MAKTERVRLITPTFRVSFPDVFEKRVFRGQGAESGRYACTALFSGFEVVNNKTIIKAPKDWPEKDQEKWNALVAACNKVAVETFKKPMRELDRAVYKLPFHRGEEKEYTGYGPGIVFFNMTAKKNRPGVIDARNGNIAIGPEDFYPGCYARANVSPFAFGGPGSTVPSKGISFGLNNLQKLKDGAHFDSFVSAEDDFGSDPAEFDDADAGTEDSVADDFGA